jgi:hypothetical protein
MVISRMAGEVTYELGRHERNTVYRIPEGEVWHFDAAPIHPVASFSSEPRIHLIFDYVDRRGAGPLVEAKDQGSGGIPADRIAPNRE